MSSPPLLAEEPKRLAPAIEEKDSLFGGDQGSLGQPLPFRVKVVRTDEQLAKAISLRAAAYGRHVPELAAVLGKPEDLDRTDKAIVFLAESKEDGSPVGTLRLQTNLHGPLSLERSVALPERFQGRPLAGVTRLAVKEGSAGRQVKLVLFKTLFRYCFATQIEWILIGARPPLDTQYRAIGFEDVFEDKRMVPFVTAENLPHRVLAFDVLGAERKWFETNHRLYKFMAYDYHPDIEVFASVSGMWSRPRRMRRDNATPNVPESLGIPLV